MYSEIDCNVITRIVSKSHKYFLFDPDNIYIYIFLIHLIEIFEQLNLYNYNI